MVSGVINHFLIVCSGGGGVGLVFICNTYLIWVDYVFFNALGKTFIAFSFFLNFNMVLDHFLKTNFF